MQEIIDFIRDIYGQDFIPLHEPRFNGNEKKYLERVIDSTYVSSVGRFVVQFENMISGYTKSKYAIAVVNGTAALHLALTVLGVGRGDEVLTQPLTFVATVNAISYTGAKPVFIDISPETLSLSPEKLREFLRKYAEIRDIDGRKLAFNRITGRYIKACVPVHVYGHPARIDEILDVCNEYHISVVEDSAEGLGSFYKGRHVGTFGKAGVLSFNGNKIITTGGGGMLLTSDEELAVKARHLSTQAKVLHKWEYFHDQVGYNYRLTNLQAALGVAQMEQLDLFLDKKRQLASKYREFFSGIDYAKYVDEPANAKSNFWLNTAVFVSERQKEEFLELAYENKVQVRPAWRLMNRLPMYENCFHEELNVAEDLSKRIVNLPSSVIL